MDGHPCVPIRVNNKGLLQHLKSIIQASHEEHRLKLWRKFGITSLQSKKVLTKLLHSFVQGICW
jgi:hypothetical protein